MRKKTILLAAVLLMIATGSGHIFTADQLNENNTDHLEEEANYFAQNVPGFLGSVVGDQIINIRVEAENGTEEVGVIMDGTNVTKIQMKKYSNATLEVNTTEKQIANITASEDPIKSLNSKLRSGEIEYSTTGKVNKIRKFVAEQLLSLSALV